MIPTKDVPEGLTADEYYRLMIQYLLLGWKKQMVISARRAAQLKANLRGRLELRSEDYERITMALGAVEGAMDIATSASGIFKDTVKLLQDAINAADLALDEIEPLALIKKEVQSAFNFWAREVGSLFSKTLEESVLPALGVPGRDLPENLSAQEYFDIARQYKNMGWCEQSRDALVRALEESSEEELSDEVRRFLRIRIPRMPVPHAAVQKNIMGFNKLTAGDLTGARALFEELTRDYPEFEWAQGNLGATYAQLGELDKAEDVLFGLLADSPDYINGWLHIARLKAARLEVFEANRYIARAIELDPGDGAARSLKQVVDFLSL